MWDQIIKRVLDVLKILAVVVPTAVSGYAYFNSEVLLKGVSDNLKPAITTQISEEIPYAVSNALLNTVIQTKLDSTQMAQMEAKFVEYQEKTLDAIPGEVNKWGKVAENRILTKKYKVWDASTGIHIGNLVGVKQAGGEWFIYFENLEK